MKFFALAAPWLIASSRPLERARRVGVQRAEHGALVPRWKADADGAETDLRLRHEVGRVLIGQAFAVQELDDLQPLVGEAAELRHR